MKLIVGHYTPKDPQRKAELRECLLYNLVNRHISEVHLINEDDSEFDINDEKIVQYRFGRRMTFQHAFDVANTLSGSVIAANADVWFDETLDRICGFDLTNKFCVVTRREANMHYSAGKGHDAWIFKPPTRFKDTLDFHFGARSCDFRLAFLAYRDGYDVQNICHTINVHHLHRGKRNWLPNVEGKGCVVPLGEFRP